MGWQKNMSKLAIIGGTGLREFSHINLDKIEHEKTPFGKTSSSLLYGHVEDNPVIFINRHGDKHNLPPHKVNYRANMWALQQAGVKTIVSINAVGGITKAMKPGYFVLPDQLIDYTYGRDFTVYEENLAEPVFTDFSYPFTPGLRDKLTKVIHTLTKELQLNVVEKATYGVTQGPRYETAAEINRMEKDGCDIVGMTAMPEAFLARELKMDYAGISLVVNWAAGRGQGEEIDESELQTIVSGSQPKINRILFELIKQLG